MTQTARSTYPIPYGNRILVRRDDAESESKGGILIPDVSKEKPTEGKVLCVGEGRMNEHGIVVVPNIRRGAAVVFSRYAGTEIDHDGETLVVLNADDVLAVRG